MRSWLADRRVALVAGGLNHLGSKYIDARDIEYQGNEGLPDGDRPCTNSSRRWQTGRDDDGVVATNGAGQAPA